MRTKTLTLSAGLLIVALVIVWVTTDEPSGAQDHPRLDADEPGADAPLAESLEPAPTPPGDARQAEQGPLNAAPGNGSEAGGVDRLIEYGRELGATLDFVKPWPDVEQLQALRSLTLASGVSSAELQSSWATLSVDDPGRVALIAAAAWAEEPNESTDQWLRSLASDWAEQGVVGEQCALAAVLAMDLGGRDGALELAAEELMELSGGDEDSPSFPGLAGIRTWHALRGLRSVDEGAWGPRFERWFAQDSPERRVNEELWALAVRSSADWRQRALDDAQKRMAVPDGALPGALLGGLAAFPDDPSGEAAPRLRQLAESERAGWIAGAAAKAIAASGGEASTAWFSTRLRGDLVARDQALEALRTWRVPAQPGPTLGRLAAMNPQLGDDADAQAALRLGMERAIDRLRFRRAPARKKNAAAALSAAAASLSPDDPWALQLGEWAHQLLSVN